MVIPYEIYVYSSVSVIYYFEVYAVYKENYCNKGEMNLGGKVGSRGYLYQAFASIFQALCQDNWDKIYVEYNSANDKVDIALERNGNVVKSIQVKSSVNSFDRSAIIEWTNDLIKDDIGATECEVFLIRQLGKSAIEFKNAIDVLQENNNDKTKLGKKHLDALSAFDTSIISNKILGIINYPFDLNILTDLLIASLLKYLSTKGFALMYNQFELISKAIGADNFLSSLGNNGIEKSIFDSQIEEYVLMLKNRCFGFKAIGVVSFERGTEYLSEATETILSFKEKFDGRKLKPEYDWDRDVYQELDTFLKKNTDVNYNYQLMLEAPLSIAFATGRILDPKSRISAFPSNPDPLHKSEIWSIEDSYDATFIDFDVRDERIDINESDTCLIISITRNIEDNVKEYISDSELKIGRMITLTIGGKGPSFDSIQNAAHAINLVQQVVSSLAKRSTVERKATVHIFVSAPNAFMFLLGQRSRGFGNCVLYEFDLEAKDTGTYSPSFQNLP